MMVHFVNLHMTSLLRTREQEKVSERKWRVHYYCIIELQKKDDKCTVPVTLIHFTLKQIL